MENFKILLSKPETENEVSFTVQADCFDSASDLANGLAAIMSNPEETYFDKNDSMIVTDWCGYVEEYPTE